MKRLFYITSIIVLSCVVASGFIIPITTETNAESNKEISSQQFQNTEYIIKSQGDRIVVFKGNMDKPFLETTTAVSSLPTDIQAKINRGISYPTEADMRKALNEFCS